MAENNTKDVSAEGMIIQNALSDQSIASGVENNQPSIEIIL